MDPNNDAGEFFRQIFRYECTFPAASGFDVATREDMTLPLDILIRVRAVTDVS